MPLEDYAVYDVFTPTTPARINYVHRKIVNDRLVDALRTPGKQVVVYGESGSGKSTLVLKKLDELYAGQITTRCTASSTFEQVLRDAFDQLDSHYVEHREREGTSAKRRQFGAKFWALKAAVESDSGNRHMESTTRSLPPQLTPQRLGEFIGAKELCWVLEDFHKVPAAEKSLISQTLKVFSDLGHTYPALKVVAIGATDTARQVVDYDREMAKRVAEVHVPLMSREELREILVTGSRLMNVRSASIASDIVDFSAGLASVCHHLALGCCLSADVEVRGPVLITLTEAHLRSAIRDYLGQASDSLKSLFDSALRRQRPGRFDNNRLILTALASGGLEGLNRSEILAQIRGQHADYPASNVTRHIRPLLEANELVIRSEVTEKVRFIEPMLHSYAQVLLLDRSSNLSARLNDALDAALRALAVDERPAPWSL